MNRNLRRRSFVWMCLGCSVRAIAAPPVGQGIKGNSDVYVALQDGMPQDKPRLETPADKPANGKADDDPRERLPELPAREVMKYARVLHFKARSKWFNLDKLEREMLKRKEFAEIGIEITRAEKYADLVIEVTRKFMTTRFTCSIIEPHSKRVVGAISASSLGGEIEPDLADALLKEFKTARAAK